MSEVGILVDLVIAHAEAGISGLTTSKEAVKIDSVPKESLPYATVLGTDYDVELLDFLQENRIWTISVAVYQEGGTREDMQAELDGIHARILDDPTLSNACDRAAVLTTVPEQNPDSGIVAGILVVRTERVAKPTVALPT